MDRINFKVNGVQHSVGCEVDSKVMLVDYLRDYLEYRGTKYMCREGGCGACVVAAVKCPGGPTLSVNACMISITSVQDWEITTIEDLGNRKTGYNILQETLAKFNGTQCGYCSPAWIMNMYSLLQKKNKPKMLEIEQAFGGNVCRCTGYRSILDAFKTFGSDAAQNTDIMDIEDLRLCRKKGVLCKKSKCDDDNEDDWCLVDVDENKFIEIKLKDGKYWFKVFDLSSVFRILNKIDLSSYMLVHGNTAKGAYPINDYPNNLIDISSVPELKATTVDQNLVLGAGLTLTEILDIFESVAEKEYFGYLKMFYDHIKLVAHVSIRNIGSLGGNLMIKHQHSNFSSDLFLLLNTVGAYLTIENLREETKRLTMEEFLKEDMKGKVIINALLPPLGDDYKIFTYKVMPRSQNAHAIVNAGFLYKLTTTNCVLNARIAYGGLSPHFNRAENTERVLVGKPLFTNETLKLALYTLQSEVVVTENPPEPSVEYRRHLATSLFYKGLINLCPKDILDSKYFSEGTKIRDTRPLSKGTQTFETNPSLWPLNQPIPKVEALIQCAGETKYTDDMPTQPYEVHAAFALTTVARGDIVSIDSSKALLLSGVIAFYTAKDIPGQNSFLLVYDFIFIGNEEVLCSGNVKYFNQPFGIIVAETRQIAEKAVKLISVIYENVQAPVVDVKEAKNDSTRINLNTTIASTDRGNDVAFEIKGDSTLYGQYHFAMENISILTRPSEEGLEVFATTQWMNITQIMISKALNIDENRIDVHVRRLGGSFGIKISRPTQAAISCSLVTMKLNRPCRFVVSLTTATRAIGKRLPCFADFVCEVNNSGVIQHIDLNRYNDVGYKNTENFVFFGASSFYNCYNMARWNYKVYDTITDTAKNTWCRSPGALESISIAEQILEKISYEISQDPFDVRIANIDTTKYSDLKEMAINLKENASYNERRIEVNMFNAKNRWRKRGLRFAFVRWYCVANLVLDVNLSVFQGDGTVIITHGGIEMGQGINTKAIQVAAYFLNIPITKIQVKANSTIIAPNGYNTGGSIGSQDVCIGVRRCCEKLLERLAPIRLNMTDPTWEELILLAFQSNVDLQIHDYVGADDAFYYDIFGVSLAEVEVDILTGESEIRRVDLIQDVGQSVSPEIDIGQIEGAFIMGQGYWTSENLVYEKKSGELLSDRTWNYCVPLARDIPQDFRVNFRRKSYGLKPLLGAKATGEPPICLSVVITFSMREAIAEARQESGIPKTNWFQIDGPYTVEKIALASSTNIKDFKFN